MKSNFQKENGHWKNIKFKLNGTTFYKNIHFRNQITRIHFTSLTNGF